MNNLSKSGKATRCIDATAAGTTDINGSTLDMQGYDSVSFYVFFGAITATAVTSIKAQSAAASDMSDVADLEGTSISIADSNDNGVAILEIDSPAERYVRVVVDRGTANAVVDAGLAIQTKARVEPVSHDSASVVGSEYHLAPAEGTASPLPTNIYRYNSL